MQITQNCNFIRQNRLLIDNKLPKFHVEQVVNS